MEGNGKKETIRTVRSTERRRRGGVERTVVRS
jgi:hypothetical protein